jgi:hypothetical protein
VEDAPPVSAVDDARGLSFDFAPGILVRIESRKDLVDSLVSDLPKEGYDDSFGPEDEPSLLSLDGWLPITAKDKLKLDSQGFEVVECASSQ